jgi:hypothetical protein
MKQIVLPVNGNVLIQVDHVGGDLQIVGWERAEIIAKSDDDEQSLVNDGQTIHAHSNGDLILYVAREASLRILQVGGDADLRALIGSVEIQSIGGDLQMRNLGSINLKSVQGDLSLRGCSGDLLAEAVGGDASLHDIKGDVKITVSSDLYLRGSENNVLARVGSDAALYLKPRPDKHVEVTAGSDILLRLPSKADVELKLQGCDDESIRVDLPGVTPVEVGMYRTVVAGSGSATINLLAGAEVIVTSRDEEWDNVAEFDPLGRDGPFAAGEFPGLSSELHERISRRVEQATRRALEASMRAQEQTDRVHRRVDSAMRRAEEKMKTAEQRSKHMGIKVGRFGGSYDNPRPSVPPQRPASEPVTDDERLAILKMLQEKKISLQDAETLLAALEGK